MLYVPVLYYTRSSGLVCDRAGSCRVHLINNGANKTICYCGSIGEVIKCDRKVRFCETLS